MKNIKPVDKITALWALSEAGLGGVFHAFKMPFTGLIIAGMSVLFLTMIAHFSRGKYRRMISATIIVMIIKMLISPHTPPTAYFAVLFQGVFGFLIYYTFGLNRFSMLFFALVALIESGFQKIITLTLFYGVSIWDSIDSFYAYLEKSMAFLPDISGSWILLLIYFGMYCLSAVFFTWVILNVLSGVNETREDLLKDYDRFAFDAKKLPKKKKQKLIGRRTWLLIILMMIIAILLIFNPEMGWQRAVYVFFRSVLVILAWYFLAAPFFKYLFERFLRKQKKRFSAELKFVIELFPTLKSVVFFSLKRNGRIDSIKKLRLFFNDVIYLTLHIEIPTNEQDHHSDRTD